MKQEGQPPPAGTGGLARYFVEHREVGWVALIAVLIWGVIAYHQLPQQEDPSLPARIARVVTILPGATALRVEQLVTRPLEKKISELESIEEISSESRAGFSIITLGQRPARSAQVDQEWDKLRAKLADVPLPETCTAPALHTDFGDVTTLLLAVTSGPVSEADDEARAEQIRQRLAAAGPPDSSRKAAIVMIFPEALGGRFSSETTQRFSRFLAEKNLTGTVRVESSDALLIARWPDATAREQLQEILTEFEHKFCGDPAGRHPDFPPALILMGGEDPLPPLRAAAMPRHSYRGLEVVADQLEEELKQVASVGRTRKIGAVGEVVHLGFSPARLAAANLPLFRVLEAVKQRNQLLAGGSFESGAVRQAVQITGEFRDSNDLSAAIVGQGADGKPQRLGELFDVQRGYESPLPLHTEWLGSGEGSGRRRAVMLAVEMKPGHVIGDFGMKVQAAIDQLRPRFPPGVEIVTVSDQPKSVARRIDHFILRFVEAVLLVIAVALLLMEWRAALIVAMAIPLTIAMTLGGMQLAGIPLHQISIAALIIALGMLVDDPVVAADGINRELSNGQPRGIAAWLGPHQLRRPIFFATLINILAFLPLVLLPGDKKFFIYALPVVVTLALVASRIVSMTFIPLLGYYLLRGQRGFDQGGQIRRGPLLGLIDRALLSILPGYRRGLAAALHRPGRTLFLCYGLLAASFALTPFFGRQFFPPAERNQFLIDIALPESASAGETRRICDDISDLLPGHEEFVSAAVFIGGSAPRFYYNVTPKAPAGNLAQFIVNTRNAGEVPAFIARLRTQLDARISKARCVVKSLEQGPPIETPIQIRISGDDPDTLRRLADSVSGSLREAGGYQVHDDLGARMPTLEIAVNQDRANALGIVNAQLAPLLRAAFASVRLTTIHEGSHPVPVELRWNPEDRSDPAKLNDLLLESSQQQLVPLHEVASIQPQQEYASIGHFNHQRTVTVKSYAPAERLSSEVLERARPAIDRMELPPGYRLEYGGEAREMTQSRGEMGRVMLISLALIMLAMVLQFNSPAKSLVVMLTVPLGLIGAFIGLALFHAPLGFMAMLAIVSLAGVIVSHIIVLSDFIEEARASGMELKAALLHAGLVRMRPVLVTVLATASGLVPLALSGGELWRPLAAVHIFGLLVATALTLFVLPVFYYLFAAKLRWIR